MGVTENNRKCRYCGKKLGTESPHKYCQECAEEHSNSIQDWKDEHLTNGHGDKPATSGYIPENKALNYSSSNMQEKHPGGKGSGLSARKTRRRMERERKEREETHAMDKPKPLEVVSDGDLSEIKKDPVWKTWLGLKKDAINTKQVREKLPKKEHCPHCGQETPTKKKLGQSHGEQSTAARDTIRNPPGKRGHGEDKDGPPWFHETDPKWHSWKRELYNDIGDPRDYSKEYFPGQMSDSDDKGAMKKKAWEVWLEKKDAEKVTPETHYTSCPNCGSDDTKYGGKSELQRANDWVTQEWWHCPDCDNTHVPLSKKPSEDALRRYEESKKRRHDKSYVTKPIPDSKGGRGSFQHCIDANQDKNNPGGWCKQIERKIGKGKDEGEKEEVKISMYDKLTRIKDRLQAHNKAKKVPKKEPKLPQTKIDEPKHWWDHSKVGRQGDIDQKTGRPWWEVATEEKERRKREAKKKAGEDNTDDVVSTVKRRKRLQDYFENKTEKVRLTVAEYEELLARAREQLPEDKKAKESDDKQYKKLTDKTEEPESDYYMDAGGNPQLRLRGIKVDGSIISAINSIYQQKQRKEEETVEANTSDANKTDYFVEEIRANIIYHNKIFPLVGMLAGAAGKVGEKGAKIGGEILDGMKDVGVGALQGAGEEAEEQ
jgi:transposase-like protein